MRTKWLVWVRRLHLYLSVFFAPLLLLFVVTGWVQTTGSYHRDKPNLLDRLITVHKNQYFMTDGERATAGKFRLAGRGDGLSRAQRAWPMKMLVVAMSIALILSIALGLVLAFTVRNRIPVWIALILGVATPVGLLALAHLSR